jgi:hypothetical protein
MRFRRYGRMRTYRGKKGAAVTTRRAILWLPERKPYRVFRTAMKIDLLLLQLAVLLLPGLIWARFDARYALKTRPSDTEFFLRAFQFGLVSYGITFLIYWTIGWPFTVVDLGDAASKPVLTSAIVKEILGAICVGFVLSILWIYSATYKWITWILQKIKATKLYGDEDVWDYTFNSPIPAVEYINFRDFENEVVYAGWVVSFSETEKLRELVLRDVQVFDFDGELLFEVPMIYLARAPENIHIEFPYRATPQPVIREDNS